MTNFLTALTMSLFSLTLFANGPGLSEKFGEFTRKEGGGIWESYIKFSVLLDEGKNPVRLLYQDPSRYEFHYQALANLPEFQGMTSAQIEHITYKNSSARKAIPGVLTIHNGDDAIHNSRFSLVTEEAPRASDIKAIYQLLLNSAKDGENENSFGSYLAFEILSHQEQGMKDRAAELAKEGIRIYVRNREADNISYTDAWGVGTVIHITSQEDLDAKVSTDAVSKDSILLAEQNLRSLPAVAGVISAVPLTPASHTVLLAQMYGIPVVYHKNALQLFVPLAGQKIFLQASNRPGSTLSMRKSSHVTNITDEDFSLLAQLKVAKKLTVSLDESSKEIKSASRLSRQDIAAYGGKSSQMGLLMTTVPQNAPLVAMGIPIYYFKTFLRDTMISNGKSLADFISSQLATIAALETPQTQTMQVLSKIRDEIKKATIPEEVIKPIREALIRNFPGPSVRLKLRSSSNVEDGEEFNGAGLYDSEGVWLSGGDVNDLEKGLKKVWASLYTDRGFIARRNFQVNEENAGMGILAQPPFKGELANGVSTIHIEKGKVEYSFEITGLVGENDEVTAGSQVQAEIVRGWVNQDGEDPIITVEQPYQGKSKETTILEKSFYSELGKTMRRVAQKYGSDTKDVNIEFEWKAMPTAGSPTSAALFLKQVRPIPQIKAQKTLDGSAYILLAAQSTTFRSHVGDSSTALEDLWKPKSVTVKMKSMTQVRLRNKKAIVEEVRFTIQGTTYTVNNPKVEFVETLNTEYPQAEVVIPLPNKHLPSLKLTFSISLSKKESRDVYATTSEYSANLSADEKDFWLMKKALGESIRFYENLVADVPNQPLDPWYDPDLKGTNNYEITVAKLPAFKLRLNDVFQVGEGDSLNSKIGSVTLSGLLPRPLQIGKNGIGYGSNHHNSIESIIVDLHYSANLTDVEKNKLDSIAGRYVYLSDQGTLIFIRADGSSKKMGPFKGGTPGSARSPVQ